MSALNSSSGLRLKKLSRKLTLDLASDTTAVFDYGADTSLGRLDRLSPGTVLEIETTVAPVTLAAQSGSALALVTSAVTIMA